MDDHPLIQALLTIIDASDALLLHTELNDLQRKFAHTMFTSANEMRDLLIVIPELTPQTVSAVFGYEMRDSLANVVGYAEVLLEESEGTLTPPQREMAHAIWGAAQTIESYLTQGD